MWKEWLEAADESLLGGIRCEEVAPRSAASRFYYAAYQAATALLHYMAPIPPLMPGRVAWQHDKTPILLYQNLAVLEESLSIRRDLRRRIERLYRARLDADYHPQAPLGSLRELRRDAERLVKYAHEAVLSGRRGQKR